MKLENHIQNVPEKRARDKEDHGGNENLEHEISKQFDRIIGQSLLDFRYQCETSTDFLSTCNFISIQYIFKQIILYQMNYYACGYISEKNIKTILNV